MGYRFTFNGAEVFRMRLLYALDLWPEQAREASMLVAEDVAQRLADAAPRGTGGSKPMRGDEPGPLYASFVPTPGPSEDVVSCSVETTQPAKLGAVTQGTGLEGEFHHPIVPVVKQALYWDGAPHPLQSVAGQRANDFVERVFDNVDDIIIRRFGEAADVVIGGLEEV